MRLQIIVAGAPQLLCFPSTGPLQGKVLPSNIKAPAGNPGSGHDAHCLKIELVGDAR